MGKTLEIERKFLVKKPPSGWKRCHHTRIIQGYFPMAGKEIEIRLRRRNSHGCLTIKGGHGMSRQEEELEVPRARFVALWPLTRAARISKTRYEIPFHGKTIELDVYKGPHRGLITADVEFKSCRESAAFQPPPWFGREITGNRRYVNAKLARRGRRP
jgi:adenylate cyclase